MRLTSVVSILLISFCFFFPHYGGFPIFFYPFIVLLVVWLVLKYFYKEKISDLSFHFRQFEIRAVLVGAVAAALLACFFQFAWNPLINTLLPGKIDLSDFSSIKHNPVNYAIVMLLALVVGGFSEELIFHGLIFTRLEKLFKGKSGFIISLVLTNLIFGAYHFQQGIKGVLLATLAGFAYHALILKFNRNLWYGIFCHAFFDFIGLTMIYLGR